MTEWARMRDPLYGAAHEILGATQRKHRDWFDENDTEAMNILDNMHTSHLAWINNKNSPSKATSYRHYKQQTQARLRAMKEAWWSDRTSEIQQASDQKDAKRFYDGLKAVYGNQSCEATPLKSAEGTTRITN